MSERYDKNAQQRPSGSPMGGKGSTGFEEAPVHPVVEDAPEEDLWDLEVQEVSRWREKKPVISRVRCENSSSI